jgi:hypothetical protein
MRLVLIFDHAKEADMDPYFVGITIVLFVASWFLVKLVERV